MRGTLGRSLGRHLASMQGRCSVRLPHGLKAEADALARACREEAGTGSAALVFVDPGRAAADVDAVPATDLLAWRTDEDRCFVLVGDFEPDSSFDSSVTPFITATFPGADGGRCQPELFARLSILEALSGAEPAQAVAEAFAETATLSFQMLTERFKAEGSSTEPWTSSLLRHWARVVSDLHDGVADRVRSDSSLAAKDAWTLFMLSGLPLPGSLAGQPPDPNGPPPSPAQLRPDEARKAASVWSDVVEGTLRVNEHVPLLEALGQADPQAAALGATLDWTSAAEAAQERLPSPEVGRRLAGLDADAGFTFGSEAEQAWWLIDTGRLEKARAAARTDESSFIRPVARSPLHALAGGTGAYLLDAVRGAGGARTSGAAQVLELEPFEVLVRAWPGPAGTEVDTLAEGGVLVVGTPDLTASPKAGLSLTVHEWTIAQGVAKLAVSARVKFGGSSPAHCRWRSDRRLQATFIVRDMLGGVLGPPRTVRVDVGLIVPSPFWPTTVVLGDGKVVAVSPTPGVEFTRDDTSPFGWMPAGTPDLEVLRSAVLRVICHDGTLRGRDRPKPVAELSGTKLPSPRGPLLADALEQLGDEDTLDLSFGGPDDFDGPEVVQVAVVRIQDTAPLATNRLRSRVKGALGNPSESARTTPLGTFETAVARALSSESEPAGLFQLVIPTGTGTVQAPGRFGREACHMDGTPAAIPGLGDGPSAALASTPQWRSFLSAARDVGCKALRGKVQDWLSALEPSLLTATDVVGYTSSHAELVAAAASPSDRFWARYPFSVLVVNGSRGPERGTPEAVLLSPMHPARLAWYFSVNCHLDGMEEARDLVGFCEGWNIPATGALPTPTGREVGLVAVPLDPGGAGDLALWSALAPEGALGLVSLPSMASGTPLPWGGRSGLNEGAIRQALDDYTALNPFVTSIQVELRSAMPGPRSAEVDRAVMSWTAERMPTLGGTCRVLDSVKRQGPPPTRDEFQAARSGARQGMARALDGSEGGRFSWVQFDDESQPDAVDVAFVENAAPFTSAVPGTPLAATAALPLRRHPMASEDGGQVWYHYASVNDDLLGLSRLLKVLEPPDRSALAVRATPQAIEGHAGVRWEVVGDVNLEPAAMARIASETGGRQLWEWRPGWMRGDGIELGAVRGAHYVLAQVPQSLKAGLAQHLELTPRQAEELLSDLGSRGIGIATLRRPGTSQEAEAAGLFYASRLLAGFEGCAVPPDWCPPGTEVGVLPVDPFHPMLQGLADVEDRSRADLVLVAVWRDGGRSFVRFIPVEVKFRATAGALPSTPMRREARRQASQTSGLFAKFVAGVAGREGSLPELVGTSLRLQALSTLVELALKFSRPMTSADNRRALLQDLLDGTAALSVAPGVVLWFLPGTEMPGGTGLMLSPGQDGEPCEALVNPDGLAGMLWRDEVPEEQVIQARTTLDRLLAGTVTTPEAGPPPPNLATALAQALGLGAADGPQASDGCGGDRAGDAIFDTGTEDAQIEVQREVDTVPTSDARPAPRPPDGLAPGQAEPPATDHRSPARANLVEDAGTVWLGAERSSRGVLVGLARGGGEPVALDLNEPKAIGVFGYMGSGKSYLLGALVEGAAVPLPGLNLLPAPMAVVVFNYRRNAADRFELASLATPNGEPEEVARLRSTFAAEPAAAPDVHVLCLPGELARRRDEYSGIGATELLFRPEDLDVEDWELLMGEPGSEAVFARVARNALQELRASGSISLEGLHESLERRLPRGSLAAAELRLEQAGRLVSAARGVDFAQLLRPGRILVVDLRQPMFNAQDATKLILVCANQVAKQKGAFNKLVVFDEAHEYMSGSFGDRFDARIRYMRHEGTSYLFATQDVSSVPVDVRRHLGTQFVFSLETRDNIQDMLRAAPEFEGLQLRRLGPGTCYVVSNRSTEGRFGVPRLISVRPRATSHGGRSTVHSG